MTFIPPYCCNELLKGNNNSMSVNSRKHKESHKVHSSAGGCEVHDYFLPQLVNCFWFAGKTIRLSHVTEGTIKASEMGIRYILQDSLRSNYRRLTNDSESAKTQRRWLKRIDGKVFGLRLKSSKRLKWRSFSSVLMQRKIAEICSDMKKNVKLNTVIVPTIFFPSQWGIPILSNPYEFHRKQSIYFDRKFI